MITIYLGDVTEYLAQVAKSADPRAQLINDSNWQNLKSGTYFTSLGDLKDLKTLGAVLNQATTIVYTPPTIWSDEHKGSSAMRSWYEDYLNVYKFRCTVKNFNTVCEFDNILHLADSRKTSEPQLWIAGCSISHGVGVTQKTRYGQLLSQQLDLNASFLTRSGSSIAWAADQILRSDVKKNDIVVWGLTSHRRFTRFNNNRLQYLTLATPALDKSTINFINSEHTLYQSVISVRQVINFCEKIGARLIIASLLDTTVVNYIKDFSHLIVLVDFLGRDTQDKFFDLGLDHSHPGPITHKFYADEIYKKLKQTI